MAKNALAVGALSRTLLRDLTAFLTGLKGKGNKQKKAEGRGEGEIGDG